MCSFPKGRRTAGAALLAALLVASACGSRLSAEERAAAIGGLTAEQELSGAAPGADLGPSDGSPANAAAEFSPGSAATGSELPTAPQLAERAGSSAATEGSGDCQPGSATGPGVSTSELRIGNVSTITGLIPGLSTTSVHGISAYLNYVNSQGGVCGRRLTLIRADDRFQAAVNRAETDKLAKDVIAFAGSFSPVDDGGAPILQERGIADVSLAINPTRIAAANNFSPNPIDPTPGAGSGLAPALAFFKEQFGVQRGAIFYQDVASSGHQLRGFRADFANAGLPLVAEYPVAPTATNFQSQASDMANKKVDLVVTIAEVNAMANLARAFGDVGYFPKVPYYGAQSYGQRFLQLAGKSANGAMAALIFGIPEEGTTETTTMKSWYERTAPGADLDFFSLQAWVAGEMLVSALRAAGPDPTQANVLVELRKLTRFESGLVAPINPAEKKVTGCFHVVEVIDGAWRKQYPASGFSCR